MMNMRRKDREVTAFNEIKNFIASQNTLRLGIFDEEYPYVVPLSYGFVCKSDYFIFYVHCANNGKKSDLISVNPKVCVEIDSTDGFVVLSDGVTVDYESFIGYGVCEECFGDEKVMGLDLLMKNCGFDGFPDGKCHLLSVTKVYKIIVNKFSCKKRFSAKEAAN